MKIKHILPLLVIMILLSSVASAGLFGNLFSWFTGNSVADEGFYVEYNGVFDLSEATTCTGDEATFILKSYGSEWIKLNQQGINTKEVYVTDGGCKGLYYLDDNTGEVTELRVIAADLVIGNRFYKLSLTSGNDLRETLGVSYRNIAAVTLSSDERTMKLASGISKTNKIYLYEEGSENYMIYEDTSGSQQVVLSTKEKITFDMADALVQKKPAVVEPEEVIVEDPVWDETRVALIETELGQLSSKIDALVVSVDALANQPEEKKSFLGRLFRG